MIDLHSHVLPGVDDGARSLEEAAQMCRMAAAQGCEVLIATPHQRHEMWWNGDRSCLEALRDQVREEVGASPRVLLGAEIRIDSQLLEEVDRLPQGEIVSLADSRYLLLEFDRRRSGPDPEGIVHELLVAGWFPILAHPELIPWLASDLGLVERLVERGAYLQVTAMSVTGEFGSRPRQCATALLEAGLVHFVASDSHGVCGRPPGMRAAYEKISHRWGEDTAWRLTTGNPKAVIDDLPLLAVA